MKGSALVTITAILLSLLLHPSLGIIIDIENGHFVVNATIIGNTLHVSIVARTVGYIGFGVSPFGFMVGSDVILAGYDASTQTTYCGDYNMLNGPPPTYDIIQNVVLVSASENATHTSVSFTRPINSGDSAQDLPILDQTQSFIWSTGSDDSLIDRHSSRGAIEVNLFDS